MGFCVFCNAAAAAAHALDTGLATRVGIIEWDVHHGNGIEECVRRSVSPPRNNNNNNKKRGGGSSSSSSSSTTKTFSPESVRFVSLHQGDAYPNDDAQRVEAPSANTRNVVLPRGAGGGAFLAALRDQVVPFIRDFEPDLVIVAAGYDALAVDAVAQLSLVPEDFEGCSAALRDAFGARLVFGLEGGYQLDQLPLAVAATLRPFVEKRSKSSSSSSSSSISGGVVVVDER